MTTNLEKIPYYELANRLVQCARKIKKSEKEEATYWEKIKIKLEQEQGRRINSLFQHNLRQQSSES